MADDEVQHIEEGGGADEKRRRRDDGEFSSPRKHVREADDSEGSNDSPESFDHGSAKKMQQDD
jgi:hypothetical protein